MKVTWNKKVASNRGLAWRKKLLQGRLEVNMNPSRVRLSRIKKNMTQEELGERVGMSETTYGAIESGRRPVKEQKAAKIAAALGLTFSQAFAPSESKGKFVALRE